MSGVVEESDTEAGFDVLFVDDEPNVLSGIRRQLRRQFRIDTAPGPEEGLARLREASYPVIVTDMRMPGMNGAEFLKRARSIQPNSVRMVLSGEASIDAAIQAVNDGSIYRYLRKPLDRHGLVSGVRSALERYEVERNERELLEKTLGGAVQTLSEALQLVHPVAFRSTGRVVRVACDLNDAFRVCPAWEMKIAASLVFIGCIAISENDLLDAQAARHSTDAFARHARLGEDLIGRIPRLERAAAMVGAHLERATPDDYRRFDQLDPVRRGAILLGLAVEVDRLATQGRTKGQLLLELEKRVDARFVKALSRSRISADGEMEVLAVRVDELEVGMVAMEPIETVSGIRLVKQDAEITRAMRTRIVNFHQTVGCREPFRVALPAI